MLKTIKYFIFLFFILGSVFTFLLFSGIKINSFSLGNFSVSKLYLKLDKKLILEIKELNINIGLSKTNEKTSLSKIIKDIENVPFLLGLFERIDIDRMKVKNNEFTIVLNDKELYIDNKNINLSAKLGFFGNQMLLDIYSIYFKDIELALLGKSRIDLSKNVLNFFGKYNYPNVEGEFNIQVTDDIFDFYLNTSKSIKSLKFLKKFIKLDEVAEQWMYDNVKGDINLKYLYGKVDLNKEEPIVDSIKGQATIDDAKISFNKNTKTVDSKRVKLDYKNDTLSFNFYEPTYNGNKLYGSKVSISDLTSLKKGVVHIDLKSDSILNDDILGILKSFKVNLPIKQLDGKLDSKLTLDVPYLAARKMNIDGTFKLEKANLKLNNFRFFAKNADIVLKDNMVYIKDSNMIYKNMLNANLKLDINTRTSTAKGEGKINSFLIKGEKDNIVKIDNMDTAFAIDFKKDTKIDLKALNTNLAVTKKSIVVDINDLSILHKYSDILKTADIKNGKLKAEIFDENNIAFDIYAKNIDFPLEKDGKKIDTLNALGTYKNGITTIKSKDYDIEIISKGAKNPLLKLKDIDINLSNSQKGTTKLANIDLRLENSILIIDDKHKYKAAWSDITINNSKINFKGKALDVELPIAKDGKRVKTLLVQGTYFNKIFDIETTDKKISLKYELPKEKITMSVNGYDVLYNTEDKSDYSGIDYHISGIKSNILINNKYTAKSTFYEFKFKEKSTDINLNYNKTIFKFHEDEKGNISVDAKNMNDTFLNALMNKNLIKGGSVDLKASGKNRVITGTANMKETKIIDLAILNNLLIFINTSPALINPLLAIPSVVNMAATDGFALNGYKINEGKIDFTYNLDDKFLSMTKLYTKGNGIDFDGYANIDFKSSKIDAKLKLIFLKTYSKVVGAIPVLNYIILGDENRVDTDVTIYGTLEKPEYKTELAKEGVVAPLNFLKRVITSPIKLIETITDINSKEKKDKKEEKKK